MKYLNIREEELKNKVAEDYFWNFDTTKIIGNVDFCVCINQTNIEFFEAESLLWAEAKKGSSNIYHSLVQLILTIGKARTFDKFLPPPFLGAFDAEKIAFIPYSDIPEIFYLNDFNWNVAPSNYETREFKQVLEIVTRSCNPSSKKTIIFNFEKDDDELKRFIKQNFAESKRGVSKIRIDKNNFIIIYGKWLQDVKPTIAVTWENAKKAGIIDADFYLADLLSDNNLSLKDNLYVILKKDHYELDRKIDEAGMFITKSYEFKDNQVAHHQFWNRYERPPKKEYWDYIINRRDLIVSQDIRERKGSFFTPQICVELSQKYLADVLGEDWQDEYYIWDCAAGTGNLLNGLTNKRNIFASTLDKQDVDIMKDRIANGANLFEEHVFQFDFLNDDFSKCPQRLQDILNDEKKRRKLIIYINPPYAEAATANRKGNKIGVSSTKIRDKYGLRIGNAINELFAQFFIRIYSEIEGCWLAQFSTLKTVQAPNFSKFRSIFKAEFKKGFIIKANLFDNVYGNFPIGFMIWDLSKNIDIDKVKCNIYENYVLHGEKVFTSCEDKLLNDWYKNYYDNTGLEIGVFNTRGNDFQNQNYIHISSRNKHNHTNIITKKNLIPTCIYFAVRHCIKATWLNDRDQFLYPNEGWKSDKEFQNDCLAFTLFHSQNKISTKDGFNYWIPFTEDEVKNSYTSFLSNFMSNIIRGKEGEEESLRVSEPKSPYFSLFASETEQGGTDSKKKNKALQFSTEAKAVLDAGRELWRYYHWAITPQPPKGGVNDGSKSPLGDLGVNASLYDIREYFQGRSETGRMNSGSKDEKYNELMTNLRDVLEKLAAKIETKVYKYGFLK